MILYKILFICFLLTAISKNAIACDDCDKTLKLNAKEWSCLKEKIPGLLKKNSNFTFFQLPKNCMKIHNNTSHKSADATPPQMQPANSSVTTYIITKSQLNCISKEINQIASLKKSYTFDFTVECNEIK